MKMEITVIIKKELYLIEILEIILEWELYRKN